MLLSFSHKEQYYYHYDYNLFRTINYQSKHQSNLMLTYRIDLLLEGFKGSIMLNFFQNIIYNCFFDC